MIVKIIVNPAAAGGRLGREWPEIAAKLSGLGVEAPQVFTEAPGHAADLAAAAVNSGDEIVVAVRLGKRVILARGAVLSFYQFKGESPLTDEEWREKLKQGQAPAPPSWSKPLKIRGLGAKKKRKD